MNNENRFEDSIFQELTAQDQATISGGFSILGIDIDDLVDFSSEDDIALPSSGGKNQTKMKKIVKTETTYINSSDPEI